MFTSLLSSRRLLPLCLTQFFGGLNDNLFKNALVILVTYRMAAKAGLQAEQVVIFAAGLFMLPFFLFSSLAGQLADSFEKSRLIRIIKLAEIGLMLIAFAGLQMESMGMLFLVLFGMGMHVTFLGPLRYSIMPDHLAPNELIAANGIIEMVTFLALLLGTIAGGLLILVPHGESIVGVLLLLIASLGYAASRFIPRGSAANPLRIGWNIPKESWALLKQTKSNYDVFMAIMGLSWFWLVAAILLAQFPTYARFYLGGDAHVVTLLLTMFSLGVGLGSVLCDRLMKGRIHGGFIPASALGIGICAILVYAMGPTSKLAAPKTVLSVPEWLQDSHAWGLLACFFALSVFGGVFSVPLYAIMQQRAKAGEGARMIAANNILNSFFIVTASLVASELLALGATVPQLFLGVGLLNLPVALFAYRLLKSRERSHM